MVAKSLIASSRESRGFQRRTSRANVGRVGVRTLIAGLLGVTTLVAFASTDAYGVSGVPALGAATPYAILGALSGENTGLSNITGDLGISSNASASTSASAPAGSSGLLGTGVLSGATALAGSLLGTVAGATTTNDTAAARAENAAAHAYQAVAGEIPTHVLSGDVLNDATLTPGVYAVAGSLQLAGHLLLDARGARNADFIFQVPSDLTSRPGLRVVLAAGAQASNVIWQVGDAVDVAPAAFLVGTILAEGSITLGEGSRLEGRALSIAGAVNLNGDTVALPLIGSLANPTSGAVAGAAKVNVPATIAHATSDAAGAVPSLAIGAHASPPLSLSHGLDFATPTLASIPAVGALVPEVGGTALSIGLPLIPLRTIGVPALAVPVIGLPTVALAGLNLPTSSAPITTSPGASSSAVPAPGLPFIPLRTVGVPALAVPTLGLPTVVISGLSPPTISLPTVTSPASPSGVAPVALAPLPLSGISLPTLVLPSSAPSSVTLPNVSAPSNSSASAPASSTLPLPLSGISLPRLSLPTLSAPSSTASPELTLPSITVPSITSGSLARPRVNVGPSSGGRGNLAHPRVKESAPTRSSRSPRAKSTNSSPSASGSPIPVGAPETGFGGMAGSDLQLFLEIGALVLALFAGTLAVRSRRLQHG